MVAIGKEGFEQSAQNGQTNLTPEQNDVLDFMQISTNSPTFHNILLENFVDGNTKAIMEHGSSVCNLSPADFDVVIILRESNRHFKIILDGKLPIELEVVPLRDLLLPVSSFHWYLLNWEFEIAKYRYGRILYDPERKLSILQKVASRYPLNIARYLFLHRLGNCLSILRKWQKAKVNESLPYRTSFVEMVILTLLAIRRHVPIMKSSILPLSDNFKDKLSCASAPNAAQNILTKIFDEGYTKLNFESILEEAEFPFGISFYYLPEVEGIRFMLAHIGMEHKFPNVIKCRKL